MPWVKGAIDRTVTIVVQVTAGKDTTTQVTTVEVRN